MAAKLKLSKILSDLRLELQLLDKAIAMLESIARSRARRRAVREAE